MLHMFSLSEGSAPDKLALDLYEGFSNHLQVQEAMKYKGCRLNSYAVVKFLGQLYGVAFDTARHNDFETAENLLVVGKNTTWTRKGAGYLQRGFTALAENPRQSKKFNPVELDNNLAIYQDMQEIDPKLRVYRYSGKGKTGVRIATSCDYAPGYACLVGRTFYRDYYTRKDIPWLGRYFDKTHLAAAFSQRPHVIKINPFQEKIMLDGRQTVSWSPLTGEVDEISYENALKENRMTISLSA